MKKIILSMILAILLIGCAKPEPKPEEYTNTRITNQANKLVQFKEDNLECKMFSNYMTQGNSTSYNTYNYTPPTSESGTFTLRDTSTGQQYQGTYNSGPSSYGSGFASGLNNGAALGTAIRQKNEQQELRDQAWQYCMIKRGWRKLGN